MRGWLTVGLLLLMVVGSVVVSASFFVQGVLAIVTGEFGPGSSGGAPLRVATSPSSFWLQALAYIAGSSILLYQAAQAVLANVRRKRASGQTWSAYIAAFAAKAGEGLPTGRPVGSRVGNILAWILLVPVALLGLIVIAILVTME